MCTANYKNYPYIITISKMPTDSTTEHKFFSRGSMPSNPLASMLHMLVVLSIANAEPMLCS